MENASKALLIAGGMLLAIIVISLFVFGYSNINELAQSKLDDELREEIERFNKPYLSYNKNVMYGTDVISILNLAISNNKTNNVKPGEELYVDVAFELRKDSVQDVVYEYKLNRTTAIYESKVLTKNKSMYGAEDFSFEINNTYSLSQHINEITAFLQTANKSEQTKNVLERDEATEIRYTVTYTGIAEFKRKTFKCSRIEYDSYGKVNYIRFQQI